MLKSYLILSQSLDNVYLREFISSSNYEDI